MADGPAAAVPATPGCRAQFLLFGLVFLVSLAANLYPLFNHPVKFREGFGPFGDSVLYHTLAVNWMDGHGFSGTDDGRALGFPHKDVVLDYEPAILRGPIYPLFIRTVYQVLGNREAMASVTTWRVNWDRIRMVQCVLAAVTSLLVVLIVRQIWAGSFGWAIAAGLIHAFCFYNIFYAQALLSESVSTFLLTASVLAGVVALKTNKTGNWVGTGLLCGLTILSRNEYLPFLLLFAVYILWVQRRQFWTGVRYAALFGGAAFCAIAPWTIRNYSVFHQLIPVSTGGLGWALYLGTFESANSQKGWREFSNDIFYFPGEKERFAKLQPAFDNYYSIGSIQIQPVDKELKEMAIRRIQAHPWDCLTTWCARLPRLWYQNYIPLYQEKEASGNWFIFYFLFAVLAFVLGAREERILMGMIGLLFVYLNLVFLPLHVEPRYGVALMPVLIALTGIGLGKTWNWMRLKLTGRTAAAAT